MIKIVIKPKIKKERVKLKTLSDIFNKNDNLNLTNEVINILDKVFEAIKKWNKIKNQ